MKRIFYIFCVIILLALIGYAINITLAYYFPRQIGYYYLNRPLWDDMVVGVFAVFTGTPLGRHWWQIIYIEKRFGWIK